MDDYNEVVESVDLDIVSIDVRSSSTDVNIDEIIEKKKSSYGDKRLLKSKKEQKLEEYKKA